jgi:hypothetical protein
LYDRQSLSPRSSDDVEIAVVELEMRVEGGKWIAATPPALLPSASMRWLAPLALCKHFNLFVLPI